MRALLGLLLLLLGAGTVRATAPQGRFVEIAAVDIALRDAVD